MRPHSTADNVAWMSSEPNEVGTTLPISVVIPTHNRSSGLLPTLASIEAQRPFAPAEVIVVDDASTDDTAEVAERRGALVVRHAKNSGTAGARNSGVAAATQPWIALLDHDDEWLPHHLATVWKARADNLIVAGSAIMKGEPVGATTLVGSPHARPLVIRDPAYFIFPGNPIPASAALVRRSAIEAAGGFRPPDGLDDLDLWIRLVEMGTASVLPVVTAMWQIHEGQASKDTMKMWAGHLQVAESFAGRWWWREDAFERSRGVAAWVTFYEAVMKGNVALALRALAELATHPQRFLGAMGSFALRFMLRRRRAATSSTGRPTVALLPGSIVNGRGELPQSEQTIDLRHCSRVVAYARLLRRPTAAAVANGDRESRFVRALGIAPISVDDLYDAGCTGGHGRHPS